MCGVSAASSRYINKLFFLFFLFSSPSLRLALPYMVKHVRGQKVYTSWTWRADWRVNKQCRAGRRLASNCLHWGAVMSSVKACKVPRPGGWKHTLQQEEPRGTEEDSYPQHTHLFTWTHTHTHTDVQMRRNPWVSLSNTHTHTPGDKGSVYHQHTHTDSPWQPPPHDTCQHFRCAINILWARPAGKISRSKRNADRTELRSAPRPEQTMDKIRLELRPDTKQRTRSVLKEVSTLHHGPTSETLDLISS